MEIVLQPCRIKKRFQHDIQSKPRIAGCCGSRSESSDCSNKKPFFCVSVVKRAYEEKRRIIFDNQQNV